MLWTAGAFGVSGCQCRRTVTRQVGQVSTIVDGTGIQGSGPRWHVLAELHGGDGQVYDVAHNGRVVKRERHPKVPRPKCDGLRSGSVLTVARYPQP